MKFDIVALKALLGGDVSKVHIDCTKCDEFWTETGNDALFDAEVTMEKHTQVTDHRSYDVGVETMAVLEEINEEITIGETIE